MTTPFPPRLTADQKADRARRQAQDGAAARAEYDDRAAREHEKIARLRAAREARDLQAAAEAPAVATKPAKSAKKVLRRNIPPG